MNLLETLLKNSGAISELAKNFDLGDGQIADVLKNLTPALSRGIQRNTQDSKGMDSLLDALKRGNHSRYMDEPSILNQASTKDDGNSILGHIFGSKEVSRNVAKQASKNTGISDSLIKKLLPLVASLAMGALSKQSNQTSGFSPREAAGSGNAITDVLGSFLDADKDGSVLDDLLGMAGKILGR